MFTGIVAAVGRNRVIGRHGDLAVRISADLRRFKASEGLDALRRQSAQVGRVGEIADPSRDRFTLGASNWQFSRSGLFQHNRFIADVRRLGGGQRKIDHIRGADPFKRQRIAGASFA